MSKWDKEYLKLCKKILTNGIEVQNRTGINSIKLDGYYLEFDLKAPELWLNPEIKEFADFDNNRELKDIKVLNYKHHGPIKFPIAQ